MRPRCRSCSAEIAWAVTASSGKPVPLDAMPVPDVLATPHDFLLVTGEGGPVAITRAAVGKALPALLETPVASYRTHFATCAHAAEHRRSRA